MKLSAIAVAMLSIGTSIMACSKKNVYDSTATNGDRNDYIIKTIDTESLSGLAVAGHAQIVYTQKEGTPSIEIHARKQTWEHTEYSMKGSTLHIKREDSDEKGRTSKHEDKLIIKVSSPTLEQISLAGSTSFESKSGIKAENCEIKIAGSGSISSETMSCTKLDLSVAGSGNIEIKDMTTTSANVSVAGSGTIKLNGKAQDTRINISGSGNVQMTDITAQSVHASIAGSGIINLNGTTDEAYLSVAGSGSLLADNLHARQGTAKVTGSGKIQCHMTDSLDASVLGNGSIGYKGTPKMTTNKNIYKL